MCSSCSNGTECTTCNAVGTNPDLGCTCPSVFYRDSNGICQCTLIKILSYHKYILK